MSEKVRIFFPIDVSWEDEARRILDEVADYVDIGKVGLELMHNIGTPKAINIPKEYGLEVMADAKLIDIPPTVAGGIGGIVSHRVSYVNLMACGARKMIQEAVAEAREKAQKLKIERPKLIAVTVLTSLGFGDLIDLGIIPPADWEFPKNEEEEQSFITYIALKWAQIAVDSGVDVLLASPKEVKAFNENFPDKEFICPGIRPPWSEPDHQKRKMTPYEAVKAGARNLVIGTPIREPKGMTRAEAAQRIRDDIDRALAEL